MLESVASPAATPRKLTCADRELANAAAPATASVQRLRMESSENGLGPPARIDRFDLPPRAPRVWRSVCRSFSACVRNGRGRGPAMLGCMAPVHRAMGIAAAVGYRLSRL